MRNILAFGAAALLGFAGIGWYLGWYEFQTSATPTGRNINIDLNTPKITEDIRQGKKKLSEYLSGDGKTDGKTSHASDGPNAAPQGQVTPTGFRRTSDGGFVYPANNEPVRPTPPSGDGSALPMPR